MLNSSALANAVRVGVLIWLFNYVAIQPLLEAMILRLVPCQARF